MAQFVIATDLNRCVGCLACSVSCKVANGVNVGDFWLKVLRIGPNPIAGGSGQWPDVEHYYLPVQCQHCADPECVKVCPTGASHKLEDGTVHKAAPTTFVTSTRRSAWWRSAPCASRRLPREDCPSA